MVRGVELVSQQVMPLIPLVLLVLPFVTACPYVELFGETGMPNPHRDASRRLLDTLPTPDIIGVAARKNQFQNDGGNTGQSDKASQGCAACCNAHRD
eukprot:3932354-Rhodomonas_salina.3